MLTLPSSPKKKPRRVGARETIVIIGAGQAGAQAAYTLREHGFEDRVVLLGNEAQAPYQRPPLSKAFLAHAQSVERLYLRPLSFYAAHDIELKLHTSVEGIERNAARIRLHGGESIGYDKLLIATGSRPRTLELPGSRGSDVHYLRTVQDAFRLRAKIEVGRRIVIVGGGYIGLEVAAVVSSAGASVTVLETEDRLMSRVTSRGISDFFAASHRAHGVVIQYDAEVRAFEGGERLEVVTYKDGSVKADVAVVGIGAEPNVELARNAGLACDNGIVVDEYCRTTDPSIFAAGDCTNHWNAALQRRMRLESVQNAVDQATTAALNMAGNECRYAEIPWFWSNQYEHKLQTAGCFAGYDEIEERGDRERGRFALVYRKEGELLGVDAINLPREYMSIRKELAAQHSREAGSVGRQVAVTQPQAA
jgi:3-phenylpropionate/trans-cinnamate dioxygenase ferredoxin reductase component